MTAPPGRVAVGTALTASFVAFARVLTQSLHRWHPDIPVFAVVAERQEATGDWHEAGITLLPIEGMGVPDLARLAFLSTAHELTVLAKPLILRRLLDEGFETVVFLDSDMLVLHDLSPVLDICGQHAVSLSPHLLSPPATPDRVGRELAILRSGTFNGGFVAVSQRPDAYRFLDWWTSRITTHNRMQPSAGMHHDQRWLDLAHGFIDDIGVVRDPGCNVAYWNLPERGFGRESSGYVVDGGPCRLFHFSGYDPREPGVLSRHQGAHDLPEPVAKLLGEYNTRLHDAGIDATSTRPYSFGSFDNGIAIPVEARLMYRELGEEAVRFGDPFRTSSPACFFAWLTEADPDLGSAHPVSRLWASVHRRRPDLQRAFPDPGGRDAPAYAQWVHTFGLQEHGVDPRLALPRLPR